MDKSGVIDVSELRRGLRAVGCENPGIHYLEMGFRGDSSRKEEKKNIKITKLLGYPFFSEDLFGDFLSKSVFETWASPPVALDHQAAEVNKGNQWLIIRETNG